MEKTSALHPRPVLGSGRAFPLERPRRVRTPWWRPRVPWTVYFYLSGEIARVTFLGVLAVSLIYIIVAAYQIVRSGLQIGFVLPLLLKTIAYPLYFSIPIAFLFGITLALGRMVGDLEITALRTHGFSHAQIYTPVFALATILSGVSFYLNGWVVPEIHYAKRNLHTYILDQLENLGSGVNRTLLLPDDEGTLWVGAYNGTYLGNVRVDFRAGRNSTILPAIQEHLPKELPSQITVYAAEGKIDILEGRDAVVLNLRRVQVLVPQPVRNSGVTGDVFHQTFSITDSVAIPLSFRPRAPGIKDRTNPELREYIRSLEAAEPALLNPDGTLAERIAPLTPETEARRRRQIAEASTEFHRRLAFTLSCLTFPLIGVSLSLLLQQWNRLVPFFLSNLIAIAVYYPLMIIGVQFGEKWLWAPAAMAIPNLVLAALGIHLTRKVLPT